MALEDYITAIEAARRLQVHPETVNRLCRQGDLEAQKFHNRWLITRVQEQPPDVWAEWEQSEESPSWMRSAIAEYSASASRWEQVRHVADLELLAEVLGKMMQSVAK